MMRQEERMPTWTLGGAMTELMARSLRHIISRLICLSIYYSHSRRAALGAWETGKRRMVFDQVTYTLNLGNPSKNWS